MQVQICVIIFLLSCVHNGVGIPIDDPSTWPGHLEPFGYKQKTVDIETLYSWPSPKEFFKEYVDKCKPALLKGVYKNSKGTHKWNEEYLGDHELSEKSVVFVEPNVKENRSAKPFEMLFKEFIETYHKEPIIMFSAVPNHFKKDLLLPSPLKCNETTKHLVNANSVISRGGSKTVVHNDDVETIYCALQGTVDVLLIEYTRNKNYVIDQPQGGYSSLDVDRVDYTKYPELRKVDQYVKAHLQEGDCFYAPYRWYKQINGHANYYQRNIALNLWFRHLHDHVPTDCSIADEDATLDKFHYSDEKEIENPIEEKKKKKKSVGRMHHETFTGEDEGDDEDTDEEAEVDGLLVHFHKYLVSSKGKHLLLSDFSKILQKDEELSQQSHKGLLFPGTFDVLTTELFQRLDINNDTTLGNDDFEILRRNESVASRLHQYLEYQTARIEDYIEDLVEANHHDEPMHLFEERMKEKFRSERKFDEL